MCRVKITAAFCPNFSTPTVFAAVDTIQRITQHCEALGERESDSEGGREGIKEERGGEKEATFLWAIKEDGMGGGGEEEKGPRPGPPRPVFRVTPLLVQIYAV